MCYIDLTPAQLWRENQQRARKAHTCSACYRTIVRGETYYRHFSVLDDLTYTEKICEDCFADRAVFAAAHDGVLCTPAALVGMLKECIDYGADADDDSERWKTMLARIAARTVPTSA